MEWTACLKRFPLLVKEKQSRLCFGLLKCKIFPSLGENEIFFLLSPSEVGDGAPSVHTDAEACPRQWWIFVNVLFRKEQCFIFFNRFVQASKFHHSDCVQNHSILKKSHLVHHCWTSLGSVIEVTGLRLITLLTKCSGSITKLILIPIPMPIITARSAVDATQHYPKDR